MVLLDLMLPDGRGLMVFEQIRRAAPEALILVLSASADEDCAQAAVRAGADDYLIKGHVDAHWLPRALDYLLGRKAAREALRRSEARFRAMSDASPLGILVSDADGQCVYSNAAYQKIVGLGPEQSLCTGWQRVLHPEDRPQTLAAWSSMPQSWPSQFISTKRVAFHSLLQKLR